MSQPRWSRRSILVVTDWPFSTRILMGLLVCVLLSGVVFAVLTHNVSVSAIRRLERAAVASLVESAVLEVGPRRDAMLRNVKDYSIWTEMWGAVRDHDLPWLKSQMVDWVPKNFEVSIIVVADRSGRVISSYGDPRHVFGARKLAHLIAEVRKRRSIAGLTPAAGEPYLLAGSVVMRDNYRGPPGGVVIFAAPYAAQAVKALDRERRIKAAVFYRGAQVAAAARITWPTPVKVSRSDDTLYRIFEQTARDGARELIAYHVMPGLDGEISMVLAVRQSARTTSAVADSIARAAIIDSGFALVLALLGALVISALITRPIRELDQTVQHIIATDDLSRHVAVTGRDEIGRLAASFNRMLERLQVSRGQTAELMGKLEERSEELAGDVRASGQRYQDLVEDMADGVLATDTQGRLTLVNKRLAAKCGSTPVRLVGTYLADLLQPIDEDGEAIPKGEEFRDRLRSSALPRVSEWYLPTGDGGRTVVELRLSTLRRGSVEIGIQGGLHDVTEERRLRELRSDLLSVVSHELKTPLSLIYGAAQTLRRPEMTEDAPRVELLGDIADQCEYLMSLVEDMLTASQIQAEGFSLHKQPLDLAEICRGTVAAFERSSANHAFSVHFPFRFPKVPADERGARQVLANLVSNAVKHSPDGAAVSVTAKRVGDEAVISVSDTGPGIPESELERIFDRFVQSDMSSTRATRGVGLGLYICRQIVELHGGRIWVESRPGKGSTFSFTLPLSG